MEPSCNYLCPTDGWAKNDLVYVLKKGNPVHLAGNLSLPGGFKLGAFGSRYCDVKTTTGTKCNMLLLLIKINCCRGIFLSEGGPLVCSPALIFPGHCVRAMLNDCVRILDVFLARPQSCEWATLFIKK